jgi:hypothetical protein
VANSKEPHRYAPETARLETRPVFAGTRSQCIGQDCRRRAPQQLRRNDEAAAKQDFQDFLVDYPRAKRVFFVGYDVEDRVTSRQLFGKWEKPEVTIYETNSLFDLRQNLFHLVFAERAHGVGLDVAQRANFAGESGHRLVIGRVE